MAFFSALPLVGFRNQQRPPSPCIDGNGECVSWSWPRVFGGWENSERWSTHFLRLWFIQTVTQSTPSNSDLFLFPSSAGDKRK